MTDFYGFPTRTLENAHLRLTYLAEGGPRIVSAHLAGRAENVFAEVPNTNWPTPFGEFRILGGHRLWHAPEARPRTSVPDHASGVTIDAIENGVRLTGAVEAFTGIRKSMDVRLAPQRAAVDIVHTLTNEGAWEVELAAWAITQLPLGGRIFVPQTRGLFPANEADAQFWPNRHMALWNYSRWEDARLQVRDDYVELRAAPQLPPCKFGVLNTTGWAAYAREGVLVVKRFTPQPERLHPDRNTNVQVYCNDAFVELETLGPLTRLAPGAQVAHVERWEFIAGVAPEATFEQIAEIIR